MLERLINGYIEYIKDIKNLSNNTILSYKRDLKKYDNYIETIKKNIEDINENDIFTFIIYLEANNNSQSSISRNISSIKSFHEYLLLKKICEKNPTSNIKKPKLEKIDIEILSEEEIELLLSAPDLNTTKGIRDKAILEVLYGTGMRVSELVELKLSDVKFEYEFINLGDQKHKRAIPLNNKNKEFLNLYIEKSREALLKKGEVDYLFLNQKGEKFTRQGLWKIIKKYTNKLGLDKNVTPRLLRHSFAIHMLSRGADLKIISEILGNLNISSIQTYLQHSKKSMREEFKKAGIRD